MTPHPTERIAAEGAPKPIGPYSQALRAGELVFCSGQIGVDPANGQLVGPDVSDQARRVMRNLSAVLTAAGGTLGDVVKTTIFLVDMADFAAVNAVYGEDFGEVAPARSTVAVAALPLGARVEIEAIALLRRGRVGL